MVHLKPTLHRSSMHALTIATELNDRRLYKDYVSKELARFKQDDGGYKIVFDVREENMDGESFTVRSYIPHKSFVDKAFYLIGTIHEHYCSLLARGMPWSGMKDYEAKKVEYLAKYRAHNADVLEAFNKAIRELTSSLEYALAVYLVEKDRTPEESYENFRARLPKVTVEIKTYNDTEMCIPRICPKDVIFSLGCYDNSEFYVTVARSPYMAREWLTNPFSAVLAGSDEMDELEMFQQEKDAEDLLEDAWRHTENTRWPDLTEQEIKDLVEEDCCYYGDDPVGITRVEKDREVYAKLLRENKGKARLNRGRVLWPIGG